ncbi:MAG: hypothetical protein L6R38_004653 [Xanthoria sp. 2 TBL-2021]|nr:MAG: hypothetical protein L6R38_004653 [Xanthoria sp. 2 TBL-2021]
MLDGFEILTTSGVVLWSKSYAPLSSSLINGFIKDIFIEEKILPSSAAADDTSASQHPSYKREKYTLRWASVKDLGLIFVAVYQSLLHLSWVDKLLDNIRVLFVDLYGDQVRKSHSTVVECKFDEYFGQQVEELESSAEAPQRTPQITRNDLDSETSPDQESEEPPPPIPGLLSGRKSPTSAAPSTDTTPTSTPDTSRPSTPLNGHLLSAKAVRGGTSRRARKAASGKPSAVDGFKEKSVGKAKGKQLRRWDADGMVDEDGDAPLDYSAASDTESRPVSSAGTEPVDMAASGMRTSKGQYILKDLDDEVHSILQSANQKKEQNEPSRPAGVVGSSLGAISGLFRNVIGGKVLTKQDLEKPMKGMEELLLKKNVAREAAVRLCEGVERELIGKKTGSFESIDTLLRSSLSSSLTKLLTPTTSLSLLTSITTTTTTQHRPYTISIVGVNGVGKSTSLSKLAFFLLQNNLSLLIAACDTFRSGAVEQLRVHARNLKDLSDREDLGRVELYEKGYGKDAAHIARDAVAYAKDHNFDVVLIDTAGRRHNDARLMSSLEKFAELARPDKILMVGEALVGTDSVMQARAFNAAFGAKRGLDGFIISKCDTVGEMVGVLVSMVHATGIPVVFLGVGQHYGDLRTVNVGNVVGLLMS